jgi:hydrogenase/urease accessory protein HupE
VNVALGVIALLASHQIGLSQGTWVQRGDVVDAELVFRADERPDVAARSLAGIVLTADGGRCEGAVVSSDLVVDADLPPGERDGLALSLRFTCGHVGRVTVDMTGLMAALAPGHRHLGKALSSTGEQAILTSSSSPAFSFGVEASPTAYLWIGVLHIWGGIDHLVFLLALILVGGRLRSLVAVVTAFTISHSITLAIAVLGLWTPPSDIVEPLIAASIAWVGIENFFVTDAERRWRITAPFGLIHGFGFAGALADVGIPAGREPLVLFLFNLGVELGQLAVLLAVLPGVQWARARGVLSTSAVRWLSAGIVLLAGWWFFERVWPTSA